MLFQLDSHDAVGVAWHGELHPFNPSERSHLRSAQLMTRVRLAAASSPSLKYVEDVKIGAVSLAGDASVPSGGGVGEDEGVSEVALVVGDK